MKLSEFGELGVVDLFRKATKISPRDVAVGIGDDCAVLRHPKGDWAVSCDAMVEGVHFTPGKISPEQLGWKALATALSDLAAVGARPVAAFLVLGLRGKENVSFIRRLRNGVSHCARRYGVNLAGGDTVRSPQGLVLSFTVIGGLWGRKFVLRSGARPGHLIAVCGNIGDSAAGLSLLRDKRGYKNWMKKLVLAHLRPQPQLEMGRRLSGLGASAMIDISDGLLRDLAHICRESGVGADVAVDRLPLSEELIRFSRLRGRDPLDFALNGGEDYKLLFCLPPHKAGLLTRMALSRAEKPAVIGKITQNKKLRLFAGGKLVKRKLGGFDHFYEGSSG